MGFIFRTSVQMSWILKTQNIIHSGCNCSKEKRMSGLRWLRGQNSYSPYHSMVLNLVKHCLTKHICFTAKKLTSKIVYSASQNSSSIFKNFEITTTEHFEEETYLAISFDSSAIAITKKDARRKDDPKIQFPKDGTPQKCTKGKVPNCRTYLHPQDVICVDKMGPQYMPPRIFN